MLPVLWVVSSLLAGVVAVSSTWAISRFGGVVGGVLASSPTTILPFSIGLVLGADAGLSGVQTVRRALYSAPAGILLACLYMLLWRQFPLLACVAQPLLPLSKADALADEAGSTSSRGQLVLMLAVGLSFWLGGAVLLNWALPAIMDAGGSLELLGYAALLLSLTVGLLVTFCGRPIAPVRTSSASSVSAAVYAVRGVLASAAVGTSLVVSSSSPTVAGVCPCSPR